MGYCQPASRRPVRQFQWTARELEPGRKRSHPLKEVFVECRGGGLRKSTCLEAFLPDCRQNCRTRLTLSAAM